MRVARAVALAQGGDNSVSSHEVGRRPTIAYVSLA